MALRASTTRRRDDERLQIKTREEWRAWLARHEDRGRGIWVVTWRRGRPHHVPYDAVVEEALCFGWIDGTYRPVDDERSMLWLAPRRPGSTWSTSNKDRIARLLDAGQMEDPGLATLQQAVQDGSWNLLDDVDDRVIPPDLAAALDRFPGAREGFEALAPSKQKQALWWVKSAKRDETRRARIEQCAQAAAKGQLPGR